jgi:hypothetical protein
MSGPEAGQADGVTDAFSLLAAAIARDLLALGHGGATAGSQRRTTQRPRVLE